jgi:hypothetical protein
VAVVRPARHAKPGVCAGTQVAVWRGMRSFIGIVFILFVALSSAARADWVPVLPGFTTRVVAGASHVAVVRDGVIWILREDGSVVGRLGKRSDAPAAMAGRAVRQEAEAILDHFDVSEFDRDSDYADDLLYDERTLAQRRRARLESLSLPVVGEASPAMAASKDGIWIARGLGVFRVAPDGGVVRELGREFHEQALAVTGRRVLAAEADGHALLSLQGGGWRPVELANFAGKIALAASGQRWAWLRSDGIAWASEAGSAQMLLPGRGGVDLVYCGETLLALLADSVLAIPASGAPETRARDIRAQRLLCSADATMPWLAVAESLLLSVDEGRHWETVVTPAGAVVTDVAASAHHLWLATSAGLFFSSQGQAPAPSLQPAAKLSRGRARGGRGLASWLTFLPKVSVRASAAFSTGSRELEAFALAAFPFDPPRLPVVAATLEETAASAPQATRPHPSQRQVELRDPDSACLSLARRKAVELAMAEPERARSYITRAGLAAWLPELRVLMSRRYGRSESLDSSSSSTALASPLGIDTVNDIRYEARATWDLAKLVFSTEELAAQTQALHMAELRRDIETSVNRLYFERRQLAIDVAGTDGAARVVRASEIEAELDSLSGGAFGSCVSGAR